MGETFGSRVRFSRLSGACRVRVLLLVASPRRSGAPTRGQPRCREPQAGLLALGALGVVYGDIGTSPLYAFRQAVTAAGGAAGGRAAVLGAVPGALGVARRRLAQVPDHRYARGQPRRGRDPRVDVAAAAGSGVALRAPLAVGSLWRLWRCVAVWRRGDHPGNLDAVRGGGVTGRGAGARRLRRADCSGDPCRPVRRPAVRHGQDERGVRTGHGRVVCRPGRARRHRDRAGARSARRCQPRLRAGVPHEHADGRLRRARQRVPGGHRRGGGSTPTWATSADGRPGSPGSPCSCPGCYSTTSGRAHCYCPTRLRPRTRSSRWRRHGRCCRWSRSRPRRR